MAHRFTRRKLSIAAILVLFTLSACGGGGGSNSSNTASTQGSAALNNPSASPTSPSSGASTSTAAQTTVTLPAPLTALIARRYSATPDLQKAATGYATALLTKWTTAAKTGVYNEKLSLMSGNAQRCLDAKNERLGTPMTLSDVRDILAAAASTPELFQAFVKADTLASGHPQEFAMSEAIACPLGGIQ